MSNRQRVICLDFESTLVPEFWPMVAKATGIDELKVTTQEYPSFSDLMTMRIKILNANNIKLPDLIKIAESMEPIKGARDFLTTLQQQVPRVLIVSDFAEELALPLLKKLGSPTFLGHRFVTYPDGKFSHYDFRQDNPKVKVVEAMHMLDSDVYAAGDSYNDITMLEAADHGFLFKSPPKIREEFPQFKHTTSYAKLLEWLTGEQS